MAFRGMANIRKTYYYLRRNGLRRTWYAVRERLGQNGRYPYEYVPPAPGEWKRQREEAQAKWESGEFDVKVSIIVPAYRTDPGHLRRMAESVRGQSYPYWELILSDATEDDSVRKVAEEFGGVRFLEAEEVAGNASCISSGGAAFESGRITYLKLPENRGISENTNAALTFVTGNYVGLLDHDDVLTSDALFVMAQQISIALKSGINAALLYSDEDKCDGEESSYYEPNFKEEFNLDLILSNNYICHFMMMESALIGKLGFRKEYDGAQDYDLILRAVDRLRLLDDPKEENRVLHIPKVLYHWRCHAASTAENPRSKQYAYDAGLRALQDFVDRNGLEASVKHQPHLGFYDIVYGQDVFSVRKDLGAVGGRILRQGKLAGGRMDEEGNVYYEGIPEHYSGYLHRAVLPQDAEAVDIRCISVREELHMLFNEIVGVPYECPQGEDRFDVSLLGEGADHRAISLKLCRAIRDRGYRILWLPERTVKQENES